MPDGEHSRSLCIFCGEDAPRYNLHKCPSCGRRPQTAHEVAYAFAYSSAVLGEEQLDLITEQMRRGEPGPTLKG